MRFTSRWYTFAIVVGWIGVAASLINVLLEAFWGRRPGESNALLTSGLMLVLTLTLVWQRRLRARR